MYLSTYTCTYIVMYAHCSCADQEVVDEVPTFTEDKVSSFEVVWVQCPANQVYGANQILFYHCILEK